MQISINAEPEEIAALVVGLQGRPGGTDTPLDTVKESVRKAIDGIVQGEQAAS